MERKFLECAACLLAKKGAKVSGVAHTCTPKIEHKPETMNSVDGTLVKVYYYDETAETLLARKYRLISQIVNGYKVKQYTEVWIPFKTIYGQGHDDRKKWFWVIENYYKKLSFI